MDFAALVTADLYFAQVAADVVLVFTQDFETEITGSVGAGGTGGAAINAAVGGTGGNGSAFFYFYS
jgi:hypothetical protein